MFKEPSKHKGGSKGVVLLLGVCGSGIFTGRFGKTSGYDRPGGWVCCAKG